MLNHIFNILQKEVIDIFRDKKALRQTLMVPLVLGIFYAILNPLLGSMLETRADEPITLPVQGLDYAGDAFINTLAQFEIYLEPYTGDMEAAIAAGEESAGFIIPEGFGEKVADEEPVTLILRTNPTVGGPFGSSISLNRIQLALNAFNQSITVARLEQRSVDLTVLAPVTVDAADLSTPAQRAGATAALFLPILVAISAVQGGMFIAIDVTAGEKERGTLEALLVTPTSDLEIFVGKLLAVFVVTAVPIALTLFGFWGATLVLPESMTDGAGALPVAIILQAIVVTLPLALFANIILMVLAIRTKTFKDAQSAMGPMVFAVTFIALAAAFVPPTNPLLFLIPIYGTSAVVGGLALGGIGLPANALLFSIVGSLAATVVGVIIALPLFNREKLLYSV